MLTTAPKTKIDADQATIVVVDVQNDFCHPDGKLGQVADVSDCAPAAARLKTFLAKAREVGVPIAWIQTWRDDTTNSGPWLARNTIYLDPQDDAPPSNCVKGTWGAEFYEVSPEPGEPISHKIRYNAFTGTDLETVLRVIGRPSLLFTGVATNMCVESTLREALFREFHVTLVHDCCASTSRAAHEATMDNVRRGFGPVLSSEDIMAVWDQTADPASLLTSEVVGR